MMPSFRGGAQRRTRNPAQDVEFAAGFRVRAFGAPRNDHQTRSLRRQHRALDLAEADEREADGDSLREQAAPQLPDEIAEAGARPAGALDEELDDLARPNRGTIALGFLRSLGLGYIARGPVHHIPGAVVRHALYEVAR